LDYINRGDPENNPAISVSVGESSVYLQAKSLETASLICKFGSLQVYFDQVELSPDGAEVFVVCKAGSIELFVPRHWRVVNRASCMVGAIEVFNAKGETYENPPTLVLSGKVSFGALEVHRLKP